ncbi:MAG: hypothetical protein ACRBBW_08875 [Cellvibrionaceae bacterium]
MKIADINALVSGELLPASVRFSEEKPWKVQLCIPDRNSYEGEANDLFDAFLAARKKAEADGILAVCRGAQKNVFPSPMMRSMSNGAIAYELVNGKQASRKDTVRIFDQTKPDLAARVEEQNQFYLDWLQSLKA